MSRPTARTRRPATFAATVLATTAVASGVVTGIVAGTAVAAVTDEGVSAVVTTAVDPNDALLGKSQLPVVNQEQRWSRVAVRHTRVSTAQPTPLSALGFEGRARRDFAIAGGRRPASS